MYRKSNTPIESDILLSINNHQYCKNNNFYEHCQYWPNVNDDSKRVT